MRNPKIRCSRWVALMSVLLCFCNGTLSCAADQTESDKKQPVADMKLSDTADKKTIAWRSYEDGFALAQAENKKTFLYFYTGNCHYCRIMDKETFTNDQVIAMLNNNFIPVRVDLGDKQALRAQYQVRGVPTSWFLESSGTRIGAKPGYFPPDQFMEMLQFVIDEKYK